MKALLVATVALALGCHHPTPTPLAPEGACLDDAEAASWVGEVRGILGNVSDTSKAYLIRNEHECRIAIVLYYKAIGSQQAARYAYAIRTADSGYVIIPPGRKTGEWQHSYWLDRNGQLQQKLGI